MLNFLTRKYTIKLYNLNIAPEMNEIVDLQFNFR